MNVPHYKGIGDVRCRMALLLAGALLLPLLGACRADSNLESGRKVVAKVNGDVITVRELNDQYSRIEARAGLQTNVGKRQILEALVDEKLLAQRASKSGLDRQPGTVAALDRARRQVLALAVIDQAIEGARVNSREIKTFYESRPDLFERRKTYVFRRFDLLTGELHPSIKAELDKAGSPVEVGFILKRARMTFNDQTEIRAAEMLPAEVLKQASEMRMGDILVFKESRQVVLMQLMRSIAEPVDLARATPAIRAYLVDSKRKNAAESLLKDLRQSARIEYTEGLIDGFQAKADEPRFESVASAPAGKIDTRVSATR